MSDIGNGNYALIKEVETGNVCTGKLLYKFNMKSYANLAALERAQKDKKGIYVVVDLRSSMQVSRFENGARVADPEVF